MTHFGFFTECTTYKGTLIAFQANLQNTLKNVPANTILKFENVKLNLGGGYNPKTGIFTAPADGVYSFTWAFLSSDGGNVYVAAMINNDVQVRSCVYRQKSQLISTTGHLVAELKNGNKVWLQIFNIAATYIHGDSYSYFSGNLLQ